MLKYIIITIQEKILVENKIEIIQVVEIVQQKESGVCMHVDTESEGEVSKNEETERQFESLTDIELETESEYCYSGSFYIIQLNSMSDFLS